MTDVACDSCGALGRVFMQHGLRIGKRVVTWRSCPTCEASDQKRWAEQRADEAREKAEREERSRKATERDAARAEKQRESKQEVA